MTRLAEINTTAHQIVPQLQQRSDANAFPGKGAADAPHDRKCAANSSGRGGGRENETEVVPVSDLPRQSLFSHEG